MISCKTWNWDHKNNVGDSVFVEPILLSRQDSLKRIIHSSIIYVNGRNNARVRYAWENMIFSGEFGVQMNVCEYISEINDFQWKYAGISGWE